MRYKSIFVSVVFAAMTWSDMLVATTLSGELRCLVHGGQGLIAATNRPVDCVYRRPGQPVEFYSGYTGVIGMSIGLTPDRIIAFEVDSTDPEGLATLNGDFTGPVFGLLPGEFILRGGKVAAISLHPVANAIGTGTLMSATTGDLHLNYAGLIHSRAALPSLKKWF